MDSSWQVAASCSRTYREAGLQAKRMESGMNDDDDDHHDHDDVYDDDA